jgi:hypothetical protein
MFSRSAATCPAQRQQETQLHYNGLITVITFFPPMEIPLRSNHLIIRSSSQTPSCMWACPLHQSTRVNSACDEDII